MRCSKYVQILLFNQVETHKDENIKNLQGICLKSHEKVRDLLVLDVY